MSNALRVVPLVEETIPTTTEPAPKSTSPSWPAFSAADDERKDHFCSQDGVEFAGRHLLVDLWGGRGLDDLERMEAALRDAAHESGATLLHVHLHHFTPNDGISGVAVLAESHISVHTWPERDYAAFDLFMCGDARPALGVEVLKRAFSPSEVIVHTHLRGRTDHAGS